jgi:serine/threonine protein kinase/TPR repeat protein/Tfp pilus assembly protein PilF
MDNSHDREMAIFSEARSLPIAERAAFLDGATGADAALRERVEQLLRAIDEAGDFLAQPPQAITRTNSGPQVFAPLLEKPGDKIGDYKLLQVIGEGGCGIVYMAEQERPVRRQVALKLIKPGMDTKSVIARFEAEQQALALMDHPNIARVLAAGAAPTGRPYFVMELVRGTAITKYCDEHQCSTQERLKLFIQVCEAIQHAHQRGVIHRDIKPSNVLVTSSDDGPAPKVIDFGIAKATAGQRLTDKTFFTAFERFVGTPAYMSPEQATMSELGVDTRSDIYSLGILLYELLTGAPPFETAELMAAGMDAMRQIIQHKEPPPPSLRLSTMTRVELTATSLRRRTDPPKLIHFIRGDLDWIVMKSLEKDRRRRYETANGLKADVQRFLNNDPITARPPSSFYQLQKAFQRNRVLFGSATAIALALIVGLGFSLWSLAREKAARQRAVEAEHAESLLRLKSELAEKTATVEAAKSRQVAQFLETMLGSIDPSVAMGRDVSFLKEILDKTAQRAEQDLTNQPAVEAELCHTLGETYWALGDLDHAGAMHRKALDLQRKLGRGNEADVADSLSDLAMVLWRKGKLPEAEAMLNEALAIQRKLPGNHLDTAKTLNDLAGVLNSKGSTVAALSNLRAALVIQKKEAPGKLDEAETLTSLAAVLTRRKALPEAESNVIEALAIETNLFGGIHPVVADSLNVLANIKDKEGKETEAEALYRQTLAMRQKLYGEEHPQVALSYFTLGRWLKARRRFGEAEAPLKSAWAIQKKLLGLTVETGNTASELGTDLGIILKYAEAEAVLKENLAINVKYFGEDSAETANAEYRLGFVLWHDKKFPEAESHVKNGVRIREKLNPEHPDDAGSLVILWHIYVEEERKEEALKVVLQSVKQEDPEAMNGLGWTYETGWGIPRNDALAVSWYKKSAATGFGWGLNNMGRMCQYGRLVPKDINQALKYYYKAIDAGCEGGMISLAMLYESGTGVPRDVNKAVELFRNAISKGNVEACNDLGWVLATWPIASVRKGSEAVELAEKAVDLTHRKNPYYIDTLAAAYAETGAFDKAGAAEEQAIVLSQKLNQTNFSSDYSHRLDLYRKKLPLHEYPQP